MSCNLAQAKAISDDTTSVKYWMLKSLKNNNGQNVLLTYKEANKFFADHYFLPKNKNFQKRLGQKIFSSARELNAYLIEVGAIDNVAGIKALNSKVSNYPLSEIQTDKIWPTTQIWSLDWEKKYSAWISEHLEDEFFVRHQIATDCADVAISLRWIFARINGLPMANSLAATGRLFTNESMLREWQNLPTSEVWFNDRRFLAALNYVLDNTFTHSFIDDSYPILINSEFLTPGTHHLDLYSDETGHTMVVNEVNRVTGGLFLSFSTVPREVRSIWTDYFYRETQINNFSRGGFLKIRWPVKVGNSWSLVRRENMPGYSVEQYDDEFMTGFDYFYEAVEAKIGAITNPAEKVRQSIRMLRDRFLARVDVVKDGYEFCKLNDCSEGTLNYENWSTPGRDSRIVLLIENIEYLIEGSDQLQRQWRAFLNNEQLIIEGQPYKMRDVVYSFSYGNYSFIPTDEILTRWGL
jgi:hypothetical protein